MLFRQWCHGRGDVVLCLRPGSTGREKTQDLAVVQSGFSILNIMIVDCYITDCWVRFFLSMSSLPFRGVCGRKLSPLMIWQSCDTLWIISLFWLMRSLLKQQIKAPTGILLTNSQKHCGLCLAAAHVQIPVLDRGPAGSAVCPPWIKLLLLAAGVCLCISVVLGRGEGSKASRVREHLESACAGEGSGGQGWLVGEYLKRAPGDGDKRYKQAFCWCVKVRKMAWRKSGVTISFWS